MHIAELEQRTGVSRHTLRYYEKEGLILEVSRHRNNYRDYPEQAVTRVNMVRQLKELGFSLNEIRDLMNAVRSNQMDCEQGAELMAQKRATVAARILELKKVDAMLMEEQRRLEASAEAQRKSRAGNGKA